jgi:hypothetical protein
MLEKFLVTLYRNLEEDQRGYRDRILSGNFETLEDYKYICGLLQGLTAAQEQAQRIYKNLVERVEIKGKKES